MSAKKPHRGIIDEWRFVEQVKGHPFVLGRFRNHPYLGKHGGYSHTSEVVKVDKETGEIETLNSRYTLGTPYVSPNSERHIAS